MIPRRVFIIHGYQGYPQEAWLPWLKGKLEKVGYEVRLPAMPDADRPTIAGWVGFIGELVGKPDANTILVGHSIGGQAVLHYLEGLGEAGGSVMKTVLVACTFPVGMSAAEAEERAGDDEVLLPWLRSGVDPAKVRRAAGVCRVILSDDDPYIPIAEATASFKSRLNARMTIEHGKGHLNDESGLTELPSALAAVLG